MEDEEVLKMFNTRLSKHVNGGSVFWEISNTESTSAKKLIIQII